MYFVIKILALVAFVVIAKLDVFSVLDAKSLLFWLVIAVIAIVHPQQVRQSVLQLLSFGYSTHVCNKAKVVLSLLLASLLLSSLILVTVLAKTHETIPVQGLLVAALPVLYTTIYLYLSKLPEK